MKKIILIGVTLLATSSAILIANNNSGTRVGDCDKTTCEHGVCKPSATCPHQAACCKQ